MKSKTTLKINVDYQKKLQENKNNDKKIAKYLMQLLNLANFWI